MRYVTLEDRMPLTADEWLKASRVAHPQRADLLDAIADKVLELSEIIDCEEYRLDEVDMTDDGEMVVLPHALADTDEEEDRRRLVAFCKTKRGTLADVYFQMTGKELVY